MIFKNNAKKFYREVGKETTTTEDVEKFWKQM